MQRLLILLAGTALVFGLAGTADAQKIDANGKCHAADGKFAKMEICKPAAMAAPTKCRDIATKKFAKCSAANTEPVPTKK